jgi:signal transduction histidine kinase
MAGRDRASARTGRREPVVVEAFSRGLDVFRPLAAAYAAVLAWQRHEDMVRPWLAWVVLGVLAAWSLAMLAYRRRTIVLVYTELALSVGAILSTLWVESPGAIAAGQFTLPTIWVAGSVTGVAVLRGARGGLLAAGVVVVADLVEVRTPTQGTIHNIVLLVLLGGLIGLAVDLARTAQERHDEMLLDQERFRERERLARVVHDGVLQTLAYVHRRGEEIGGPAGELAALAAEQERSLRRLVAEVTAGTSGPTTDLRALLGAREGERVSVSVPADPIELPSDRAREIDAAVAACLDNVERHAGPGARAWVLVESGSGRVGITVRDNGVGADLEELLAAGGRGRMGVRSSIRGRVEDLGGSASWTTRPGAGCTVHLDVPEGAPR